jgi:hypothetical protein
MQFIIGIILLENKIKNMKYIKTAMLLATTIVLCTCSGLRDGHLYITVFNQSDRDIVYQSYHLSGSITEDYELFQCRYGSSPILSDSSIRYYSGRVDWEHTFNAMTYIRLLIMDREVFSEYIGTPCDTIRKYVPVLHVYLLTLEDLQRMNWVVIYPPEN